LSQTYDFIGVATKYDVKCTDGRTIKHGAFAHQDKAVVPMVWRHQHQSIENVLGNGVLINGKSGVKFAATFNNTSAGQHAKELIKHGDIRSLSIYANRVVEHEKLVQSGNIREVSLVFAGANPGATIQNVFVHSDDPFEEDTYREHEVIIHFDEDIVIPEEVSEPITHATEDPTLGDVLNSFNEDQMTALLGALQLASGGSIENPTPAKDGEVTFEQAYGSLNEEQRGAFDYIVGLALPLEETVKQEDDSQGETMTTNDIHNIFEEGDDPAAVSHAELNDVLFGAITSKVSLSDAVVSHGITNIQDMFPDNKLVESGGPAVYDDDQVWVGEVLKRVRRTPFARIKSSYADLTPDEARAKGYVTGAEKFESVYQVATRVTNPQTVYTKQSLDRDDVIDIVDFNVVTWMKAQMRNKLREELAQAILISDGRVVTDPDKIIETNIRPIMSDEDFYAHKIEFDGNDTTLDIIDGVTAGRIYYKGSGAPAMFIAPSELTKMILIRDADGRRIYDTEKSLAAAMRVSSIVEVPAMEGQKDENGNLLIAIVVNLRDYVLGADRGGQTTMFDDFDIDFNKLKYLLETRVSGALVKAKSALVFTQGPVTSTDVPPAAANSLSPYEV